MDAKLFELGTICHPVSPLDLGFHMGLPGVVVDNDHDMRHLDLGIKYCLRSLDLGINDDLHAVGTCHDFCLPFLDIRN